MSFFNNLSLFLCIFFVIFAKQVGSSTLTKNSFPRFVKSCFIFLFSFFRIFTDVVLKLLCIEFFIFHHCNPNHCSSLRLLRSADSITGNNCLCFSEAPHGLSFSHTPETDLNFLTLCLQIIN